MRTVALVLILLTAGGTAGSALAARDAYTLAVDVPVRISFTGSASGSAQPSGASLSWYLPLGLGLGYEAFDAQLQIGTSATESTVQYQVLDALLAFSLGPVLIDLGYGTGNVSLASSSAGGITYDADDGDVRQRLVRLGWELNPTWHLRLGIHDIRATVPLRVNGAPTGTDLDLDGLVHTIGIGYGF